MSEQEIKENNKLIAEFMGFVKTEYLWVVPKELRHIYKGIMFEGDNIKPLKFHNDWNWLIPVFEKIGNIFYKDGSLYICPIIDIKDSCYILVLIDLGKSKKMFIGNGTTIIEKVYDMIVKFIKWYNLYQKEK